MRIRTDSVGSMGLAGSPCRILLGNLKAKCELDTPVSIMRENVSERSPKSVLQNAFYKWREASRAN